MVLIYQSYQGEGHEVSSLGFQGEYVRFVIYTNGILRKKSDIFIVYSDSFWGSILSFDERFHV